MNKYQFTDDMAEISGFGGSYEKACQAMLIAALEWLDRNPNADPQFRGWKNVYGIIEENNGSAKAMSAAIVEACRDYTGAMHQAVVARALWIRKHGWKAYCQKMREVA